MENKWGFSLNKVVMASVAALLAATGTFATEASMQKATNKCEVTKCDETPGPFAFSYPKDICLACPNDFYAQGQFLLMKGFEEGLEFAIENSANVTNGDLTGGEIKGLTDSGRRWKWNYGVRAGFGFYMGKDHWNVDALWTYVRLKGAHSATVKTSGDALIGLWLDADQGNGTTLRDASAKWTGNYDTLDFMIGKPYHVSRYFTAQPQVGVRGAWIDQNYLVRYSPAATVTGIEMNAKNNFWGVGLRTSLDSNFILGSGWTLFGKLSASLLYSKFDIDQSLPNSGHDYEFHHDFYTVVPNMDISLGLGWNRLFDHDKYRVELRIAYEFHQWWKQNRMRQLTDSSDYVGTQTVANGDLSLNGFSFAIQFDF